MKTWKRSLAVTACAVGISLAVHSTSAIAADEAAFKAAYAAADAARKAAADVMFEWRDTGKMLKKAKSLADKGKFDEAVALANAAREQGELAQAQAKRQETAWKAAVIQ